MNKILVAASLGVAGATPALATGRMVCSTAGPSPIEVSVGFGHVPGAPVISSRLADNKRNVPVHAAQWWLDNDELRLLLTDPNATRREAIIKTKRAGAVYDGSLWRGGQRRWVRCREG